MENLVSDGRLFIDFGETEGGSGGAAIELTYVTKVTQATQRSVEPKKAMGSRRRGAVGYIRKGGGGMLTMTELRHANPQIRWMKLENEDKIFMLTLQDDEDGGVRQRWFGCTVSKFDPDHDDDGGHSNSIEIAYLRTEEAE